MFYLDLVTHYGDHALDLESFEAVKQEDTSMRMAPGNKSETVAQVKKIDPEAA